MKILHTADWHLGHRLLEQSQHQEQLQFLNWLEQYIRSNQIDVLLVAGDIFDTGVPSAQSQKLYYDFLIKLTKTNCSHIVITGGNHDAPATINAPKELLRALSVHVVGRATENIEDEVFKLSVGDEAIIVAAVPYLRDQDIRRAVAGETFEQIGDRYKMALTNHYKQASEYCTSIKEADIPIFAMGHLFAIGGSTSDSEQTIYVGNLGDIGAEDFPPIFDYIALGHLHRMQKVADNNYIRYSGSPYILSFSEAGSQKGMIVVETKKAEIVAVNEVPVPEYRKVMRVSGSVAACVEKLKEIDATHHSLMPWVSVVIENDSNAEIGHWEINKTAEELDLKVLKVTLKNERKIESFEELINNAKQIKELSPTEVFKEKCKELDFDIENSPEILDAFHEALQIARDS